MVKQYTVEDMGIKDPDEFIYDAEFDGFRCVEEPHIVGNTRWTNQYEAVFQRKSDETFWRVDWDVGATEYQEVETKLIFNQVYPKQVTKTIYTTKKED